MKLGMVRVFAPLPHCPPTSERRRAPSNSGVAMRSRTYRHQTRSRTIFGTPTPDSARRALKNTAADWTSRRDSREPFHGKYLAKLRSLSTNHCCWKIIGEAL
jgi:hypothetical protein